MPYICTNEDAFTTITGRHECGLCDLLADLAQTPLVEKDRINDLKKLIEKRFNFRFVIWIRHDERTWEHQKLITAWNESLPGACIEGRTDDEAFDNAISELALPAHLFRMIYEV